MGRGAISGISGLTCRDCETPITGRPSGLCAECKPHYCCTCGERLPEGRKSRRCRTCNIKSYQQARALPFCSRCGGELPEAWSARWCADCRRSYRNGPLVARKRAEDRTCRDCGAPLPAGRWSDRCTDCEGRWRKQLASRPARIARGLPPTRPCAICGDAVPSGYRGSYCPECKADYNADYWQQYRLLKE